MKYYLKKNDKYNPMKPALFPRSEKEFQSLERYLGSTKHGPYRDLIMQAIYAYREDEPEITVDFIVVNDTNDISESIESDDNFIRWIDRKEKKS